ncbi:MAG: hypothetical protein WBW59_21740 [Pseudolabrys sp.]
MICNGCVLDDVPHALDISPVTRKNEIAVALGTICAPLLERVDDDWGKRNIAFSGFRLCGADGAPGVGALTHMDHAGIEIDVGPL